MLRAQQRAAELQRLEHERRRLVSLALRQQQRAEVVEGGERVLMIVAQLLPACGERVAVQRRRRLERAGVHLRRAERGLPFFHVSHDRLDDH